MHLRRIIFVLLTAMAASMSHGQVLSTQGPDPLDADSMRTEFRNQPYFGLYKDNYFIFGPSVGPKANKANTNVKFQISIAQRLTRGTVLWGSYLYLFYSQKCFWNVCQRSLPMTDLNFNPGLGLTWPLYAKNRFVGKLTLMIEHESNGRDGGNSRSWNRAAVAANVYVTRNMMVHAKAWVPYIDGGENKDILSYNGVFQAGVQLLSSDGRFCGGVTVVPRHRLGSFNTVADFAFRIFKRDNQYLFAQFYNGYGEGLLDYNKFTSHIRVGILIKPRLFSDF